MTPDPPRDGPAGRAWGPPAPAAVLALAFLAAAWGRLSPPQAQEPFLGEIPGPAALCGARHPGSGATAGIDVAAVREAYRGVAEQVARGLRRTPEADFQGLRFPPEEPLPACRESGVRIVPVPGRRESRWEGRTLVFLRGSNLERWEMPRELEGDRSVECLVVGGGGESELAELSGRLGLPVSRATAFLARALGVRCATTWIRRASEGEGLEVHEAP